MIMRRLCGNQRSLCGALVGLVLCAMPPRAWAAAPLDAPEGTARFLIIAVTVFVALVIGILLYHFSQRSTQAKFDEGDDEGQPGEKDGLPRVLDELHQLPVPSQQRERLARAVSAAVSRTVEERVGTVKRELTEHYGQLLEERRRKEVIVQRKFNEALAEKKQTVAVLESLAEGLVVINNKGDVVMMNPAAEKLLAVKQHERVGKPLLDDLKEGQLISLSRGTDEDREIVLSATDDSTKKVLRASNAVITDENGKAVGMVAVLSDVTKQREIEQLKSEFVSKVSHELRTPILAMRHALSILTDQVAGPMTEEQLQFGQIVERNLQQLGTLINDLLDLSKLEANKMELRRAPGSVVDVIKQVCESLTPWAQSKELTLAVDVPPNLPQVAFDQTRITQVLTNLIGNAVKFTPKRGRITIEARLNQTHLMIEVSVSDTGTGIAKEDLPKLFNKFQQVGERTHTDISGTGLGLVIAKEIVELHHGRIWAESELERGARFTFTLPLEPPPSASPASPG